MRPINKKASKILDKLIDGLAHPADGDSSRKINNSETYMPLHVERVGNDMYSIAHYFEQNGDLVPDPEMEIIKVDGRWFPVSATFATGVRDVAIIFDGCESRIDRIAPRLMADLAKFAGKWIDNIKYQQAI